jgi:hypothetical protein
METEIKKKIGGKVTVIVLLSLIAVLIIYYSVMSMMGPGRKLDTIRKEYSLKTKNKDGIGRKILKDSEYLKLLKEKAFLQSETLMAETDSIYLTLNMKDSTANLEISGVVVHKAKMTKMSISRILSGSEDAILSMFSTPLNIASSIATIKKEPVMIKIAPKDTSEYKPDIVPDTTIVEPVNYILQMNEGIRIYIYQDENVKSKDRLSRFRFDLSDRIRDIRSALKRVAVLKVPEYHPFIKIRLPRADAKIIYRALPKNGQIAVFL